MYLLVETWQCHVSTRERQTNLIEKYKQKYRVESSRLQGYDYFQNGLYFITICTKNCEHFFGSVENGKIVLNDIGKIADQFWQEIPLHFPFVKLDIYKIMPNHLHGLVEILSRTRRDEALPRLYTGAYPKMSKISPRPGSLSVIIGSFKSAVSKIVRKQLNPITFAWQSRFYDHIIRDGSELNRIREYIQSNSAEWERDRNLPARFAGASARRAGEAGNPENLWM